MHHNQDCEDLFTPSLSQKSRTAVSCLSIAAPANGSAQSFNFTSNLIQLSQQLGRHQGLKFRKVINWFFWETVVV